MRATKKLPATIAPYLLRRRRRHRLGTANIRQSDGLGPLAGFDAIERLAECFFLLEAAA
jgi:hypothetical protein